MRIEITSPASPAHEGSAEVVLEIGDPVLLVDAFTLEWLSPVFTIAELPCVVSWDVPRTGHVGWGLLNVERDLVLYRGDLQLVHKGDRYSLDIPDRG